MNIFIIAILTMGGLGLFFATVLAVASEKLKVHEDPKVKEVFEALPGLNCGACGQAGCHALAEKIVKDGVEGNSCPPGGSETAEAIAKIMGVEIGEVIKKRAVVKCGGFRNVAPVRAEYDGIKTCKAAQMIQGGFKACIYGCLGLADCVRACPFGAITIKNDLAVIDEEKCTACGLCVAACPRGLIEIIPSSNRIVVKCMSKDKGAVVRKVCKVGCIACNICVKTAPEGYKIENFLARVNHDKGDAVAEPAIAKCPTKCIVKT